MGKDTGVTRNGMAVLRPAAFLATAVAAGAVLAFGIFREEIGEVLFNAAML